MDLTIEHSGIENLYFTVFGKKIQEKFDHEIVWENVYKRIYKTTIDSYLRYFQYKIVNFGLICKKLMIL